MQIIKRNNKQNPKKNINFYKYSKYRISVHFIIIAIIVIISGIVIINSSAETLFEFGNMKRTNSSSKNEILYKGDKIILYDFTDYIPGNQFSREENIQLELERCALYFYAAGIDISVTDEQVKARIKTDRRINDYIANREDFYEMLHFLGLSEEKYWECDEIFIMTKRKLTVEKLLSYQRKIIQHNCVNESESEINRRLEKWRINKIDEVLKGDNVHKIYN